MYFSYCILTSLSISKCIVWTNLLWSPEKKDLSLLLVRFGWLNVHLIVLSIGNLDLMSNIIIEIKLFSFIPSSCCSILCIVFCCPLFVFLCPCVVCLSSIYDLIWLVLLYLQTFLSILLKTIITSLKNKCINNSEALSNYYRLILSSLYTYIFDKFIHLISTWIRFPIFSFRIT